MTYHRTLLLTACLSLVAACKDTPRTSSRSTDGVGSAAVRAASAPSLRRPAGPVIADLDHAPADAAAYLESTVLAIVENRTLDFVDTVSTGGFTIGTRAMDKEQTRAELNGRTVAELTNVTCATVDACRWSVTAHGARQLQLEARANGTLVGAVVLVREDDGSWGVSGAIPM